MGANSSVDRWVNEMIQLCQPDKVVWCDGSVEERDRLTTEALSTGEITELNQELLPGCYLHPTAQPAGRLERCVLGPRAAPPAAVRDRDAFWYGDGDRQVRLGLK